VLSSSMEVANGATERWQRRYATLNHRREDLVEYAGMETLGSFHWDVYGSMHIAHLGSPISGCSAFPVQYPGIRGMRRGLLVLKGLESKQEDRETGHDGAENSDKRTSGLKGRMAGMAEVVPLIRSQTSRVQKSKHVKAHVQMLKWR
jgi:hypothetical protein